MPREYRPAPFLPDLGTLEYLSSLLTVLAVLYAAFYIHRRDRRARAGHVPYGPSDGYRAA